MKTVSAQLQAHYTAATTTLAQLWKATRADGQVFGFTNHDRPIVYDGIAYEPSSVFSPSAVATRGDANVDNLEIMGIVDSEGITDEDIEQGRWDGAAVEIVEVNWADLSMGHNVLRVGTIGQISRQTGRYVFELRGLMQALHNNVGRIVTPICDAELGDARCTVDTTPWQQAGQVTAIVSRLVFETDADLNGPYERGFVEFTSGAAAGLRADIRVAASDDSSSSSDGGGTITLQLPLPVDLAEGDTLVVHPGCPKTKTACIETFDNLLNFRGFSFVPGQDAAVEIGGQ